MPPAVRAVVTRMMEKKPAHRYHFPIDLVEDLAEILGIPAVPSVGKAEMPALAEPGKSTVPPAHGNTPDPAAGVCTFVWAPSDTSGSAADARRSQSQ